MSQTRLEPGDIVSDPVLRLGLVMRNDQESGLLIAFPGMDELIICHKDELQWIATIQDYRK